jgi:hypothetical protein
MGGKGDEAGDPPLLSIHPFIYPSVLFLSSTALAAFSGALFPFPLPRHSHSPHSHSSSHRPSPSSKIRRLIAPNDAEVAPVCCFRARLDRAAVEGQRIQVCACKCLHSLCKCAFARA